jgi:hypothetical protein
VGFLVSQDYNKYHTCHQESIMGESTSAQLQTQLDLFYRNTTIHNRNNLLGRLETWDDRANWAGNAQCLETAIMALRAISPNQLSRFVSLSAIEVEQTLEKMIGNVQKVLEQIQTGRTPQVGLLRSSHQARNRYLRW